MCRIAPYKGGWRGAINARIHAIEAMLLPVPSPDYFGTGLEEKVPLRHREDVSRLAREKLAVSAHFIGLRVHLDPRAVVVGDHGRFAEPAAAADGARHLPEPE